jgi:trk system potassium uptake protein TrkH
MKELMLGRYGTDIVALKRRIPIEQAYRAFLICALSASTVGVAFFLIMLLENQAPLKVLFEVFSAFGTVGLSLGSSIQSNCNFAYDLFAFGKLVLILVMITGRVGTITIGGAILKRHLLSYSYPEESIVVG